MRVLIASDKYKGSLTATQVAQTISRILEETIPGIECDLCPIADGGEGTTEAMVTALDGAWIKIDTLDAQSRPRQASYGWCAGQAVMEMSAASGLALVNDLSLNPHTASTYGTGLMLKHALEQAATRIVIGIGGSATNDAGLGMAAALGYQFLDEAGNRVKPVLDEVLRMTKVKWAGSDKPPVFCPILVACDVDNPLLGVKGATQVYGAQKGVKETAWFEERLTHLADLVAKDLGQDPREIPGAGAAGGLGWGLMAFCGAQLTNGFDLVAEQIGLEERVTQADLVITGEGRLDAQTLHGKGPVGIAQMARRLGKKVAAFAGAVEDSSELQAQFDFTRATKPADMPLAEAIARAEELLAAAVRESEAEIRSLLGH
ncbi:glycerate kinase [Prosthecobacter fusiformis]|uniref:Glycerate kinase n=1 Tax=Prosthecobacter fusiformis TaxID=48464 RepID=A0A4R7S3S4_9BACT|nr:glycerate kinase [Prosthecobacter fusiformis]TDU73052.1 glycerate kinase [Prosthecobacter fusiformis]